jgi:protein SSD1
MIGKSIHSLYQLSTVLRRSDVFTQIHEELEYQFEGGNEEEPTTVSMRRKTPIVAMVKEFLFLANKSVAQKISSHFPNHALLRRQAPPSERKLVIFIVIVCMYVY